MIVFADANLEAAVRQVLGIPSGPIYPSNMANLTSLDVEADDITSLEGLESAVNLTSLILDGNQITDLTPLQNLSGLNVLSLDDNQITSLQPLQNLNQLLSLELDGNQITTLGTALSGMGQLAVLDLGNNSGLSDISSLASNTNLQGLYLGFDSIVDLTALQNLNLLTYVELEQNQITDLTALVNNTGLGAATTIYLTGNPLSTTATSTEIPELIARSVNVITSINPPTLTMTPTPLPTFTASPTGTPTPSPYQLTGTITYNGGKSTAGMYFEIYADNGTGFTNSTSGTLSASQFVPAASNTPVPYTLNLPASGSYVMAVLLVPSNSPNNAITVGTSYTVYNNVNLSSLATTIPVTGPTAVNISFGDGFIIPGVTGTIDFTGTGPVNSQNPLNVQAFVDANYLTPVGSNSGVTVNNGSYNLGITGAAGANQVYLQAYYGQPNYQNGNGGSYPPSCAPVTNLGLVTISTPTSGENIILSGANLYGSCGNSLSGTVNYSGGTVSASDPIIVRAFYNTGGGNYQTVASSTVTQNGGTYLMAVTAAGTYYVTEEYVANPGAIPQPNQGYAVGSFVENSDGTCQGSGSNGLGTAINVNGSTVTNLSFNNSTCSALTGFTGILAYTGGSIGSNGQIYIEAVQDAGTDAESAPSRSFRTNASTYNLQTGGSGSYYLRVWYDSTGNSCNGGNGCNPLPGDPWDVYGPYTANTGTPAVNLSFPGDLIWPAGGTATPTASPTPTATPNSLMIDDMENGTNQVLLNQGRDGFWSSYSDGSSTIVPAAGSTFAMSIPGYQSNYAAQISGTLADVSSAYAGMDFGFLSSGGAYNIPSSITGVVFEAKVTFTGACVPPPVFFFISDATTNPVSDPNHVNVPIGATWQAVTVYFNQMMTSGRAVSQTHVLDTTTAMTLGWQFNTSNQNIGYDLWVDNVQFITATPPAAAVPPSWNAALIDNFEQGDNQVILQGGRNGYWYVSADANSTICPLVGGNFEPTSGGDPVSPLYCDRIFGTVASGGYAQLGMNFTSPSAAYNAASYTGFTFYAKAGAGSSTTLSFGADDEYSTPSGGFCGAGYSCYQSKGTTETLTNGWVQYTVPFASMSNAGDAGHTALDPSQLYDMGFNMNSAGAFDMSVDDVGFY